MPKELTRAATTNIKRRTSLALAVGGAGRVRTFGMLPGIGAGAACRKSQTGDEGIHLAGGVFFWATSDYRVQPASGNWPQHWCGLPVWLAGYRLPSLDTDDWRRLSEWQIAETFCYASGNDIDRMLLAGRLMTAALAVALGLLIFAWSRALFGTLAGLVSLTLFVFSPTMLATVF